MFSIGARTPTNPEPTNGHMWFSPIIPRTGEAIFEANRVFAAAAKEFGLPVLRFSLPSGYWERAFIYIFAFPVTRDVETNKKNRATFKRMIERAAEHGWGEYRTAPAYQDTIMKTYSYNNNVKYHNYDSQGRSRYNYFDNLLDDHYNCPEDHNYIHKHDNNDNNEFIHINNFALLSDTHRFLGEYYE